MRSHALRASLAGAGGGGYAWPDVSGLTVEIETTTPDEVFTLPSAVVGTYDIDWGDGSTETGQTSNAKSHTYATAGLYTWTLTTSDNYAFGSYQNSQQIKRIIGAPVDFPFVDTSWLNQFRNSTIESIRGIRFPSSLTTFDRAFLDAFFLSDWGPGMFDDWSPAPPISNRVFASLELDTVLTPEAAENFLNSLAAGGAVYSETETYNLWFPSTANGADIADAMAILSTRGWTTNLAW